MSEQGESPSSVQDHREVGSMTDQIAALLMEDSNPSTNKDVSAKPVKPDEVDELEADDTLPEDSTDEEEEPEESAEDDDEPVTWASTLGVDDKNVVLDDKGNLAGINVKVDGKVSTVTVKDLISGFQINKSNTIKSQELAEQRKEFDSVKAKVAEEYSKKIESIDKLTDHLKKSLVGEYQNIDWNRLRAENPGEYAAAVQDFNMRNNEIEQILSAVNGEKQQLTQQQIDEQQAHFQNYIKGQAEILLENNPEWADKTVMKKAIVDMASFVNDAYGYTEDEFKQVQDARMLEVIKDAMKYRQGIKAAKTKLEANIPKMVKSTGKSSKPQSKLDILTKKAQTSSGYHKRGAETDAVAELLRNLN